MPVTRWTGQHVFARHPSGAGETVIIRRAWVGARSGRLCRVEAIAADPVVSQAPQHYRVAQVLAPASARYAAAGLSAEITVGGERQ